MLTRKDMLEKIRERECFDLGPVKITYGRDFLGDKPFSTTSLWVNLGKRKYEFVVEVAEVTALGTPKSLQAVARQMKERDNAVSPLSPPNPHYVRSYLVIAPYLSEKRLNELEKMGISGLDLCGNGVLIADGLFVYRTGQKNRYPQSTRLRNVYRKKSSIIARALLIQPEFLTGGELVEFINARGGNIAFSLVSKALMQLAEDMFIWREGRAIRTIQGEEILQALCRDYKPPRTTSRWLGRCNAPSLNELARTLQSNASSRGGRLAMTGASSASIYSGFAGEPILALYTDMRIESLLDDLDWGIEETKRFANLEIFRTDSDWVYFDSRIMDDVPVACPIQTYLELANGDTRQKKAAEQVRDKILSEMTFKTE